MPMEKVAQLSERVGDLKTATEAAVRAGIVVVAAAAAALLAACGTGTTCGDAGYCQ